MGLELPEKVVAPTESHRIAGNITALKPRPFRSLVENYPAHFDETVCVFLLEDARCGLQVLADRDATHLWYYKPFSCWLLPFSATTSARAWSWPWGAPRKWIKPSKRRLPSALRNSNS